MQKIVSSLLLLYTVQVIAMESPDELVSSLQTHSCWHAKHNTEFNNLLCKELEAVVDPQKALLVASGNADDTKLRRLLKNGINPTTDTYRLIVYSNCFNAVFAFVEHGFDINTRIGKQAKTALIHAVSSPCTNGERIERFLALGADANIQDANGKTAFIHATLNHNTILMSTLMLYGANPYVQDHESKSALDYAQHSHGDQTLDIVQTALNRYRCRECKATDARTVQLLACPKKHTGHFICAPCRTLIKAQTNECPLCKNQLT